MTAEDRLIALETRLAHQERMAEEISEVLAEQARVIARLTLQLRQMHDRVGQMEVDGGSSPQDDRPPPHY
jgi:SlyX protein